MSSAFKRVCQQSTDFHFPDIDVQLGKIQECALIRNVERSEADMNMSLCSTSSEEVISPPDSALGELAEVTSDSILIKNVILHTMLWVSARLYAHQEWQ